MQLTEREALANQSTYRDRAIVAGYARTADLKAPERAVLTAIEDRLPQMRMLDIGVGGGRTTLHFAHRAGEYVGIDYSEEMVAACRARFASDGPALSFAVADARRMTLFADRSFDFVLFSFNGIDAVPHDDRLQILQEVARVGRSGGMFCFSTHNLQHFTSLALTSFRREGGRAFAKKVAHWLRLRSARRVDHVAINDGVHDGRVLQYYVTPAAQIAQLAMHFTGTRVFSGRTGRELGPRDLGRADDPWLYYLTTIR